MKRVTLFGAFGALAASVYLAVMSFQCRFYCKTAEDRIFYTIFRGEDTSTFAKRYDEQKFSSLSLGMSDREVRAILGDPLRVDSSNGYIGNIAFDAIWWYSRGGIGTNYWFRQVLIRQGKVVRIEAKYFVD